MLIILLLLPTFFSQEYLDYTYKNLYETANKGDKEGFDKTLSQYRLYSQSDISISYDEGIFYKIAAKKGHIDFLKYLCTQSKDSFKEYSKEILNIAILNNQFECIRYLINEQKLNPEEFKNTTTYNYYQNIKCFLNLKKNNVEHYKFFKKNYRSYKSKFII